MYVDASAIPDGGWLDADVCVVGAGPAGIALALELDDAGACVVLLESGGAGNEPGSRGIYLVEPGRTPRLGREPDRRGGLGGNTRYWSGNCRPLEPADFRPREWIPHSGWPIGLDDLWPFYERAHRVCGLGDFGCYDLEACRSALVHPPLGADPAVLVDRVVHTCPVLSFAELHGERLGAAASVRVVLHARALRVLTRGSATVADGVEVARPDGRRFRVAARLVVLATGGVENPRLLLRSTDSDPRGLGNAHDLVGRFFMEHWFVDIPLDAADVTRDVLLYQGRQEVRGTSVWAQLALAEPYAAATRAPGLSLWFQSAEPVALGARAAAEVGLMARGWMEREDLATELRLALADPRAVTRDLWRRARRRPRGGGAETGHAVRVQIEQLPDPENRVRLSADRDALGEPRMELRLRLSPDERRRHLRSLRAAADAVGLPGRRLARQMGVLLEAGRAGFFWHHMGTTRMHEDATRGVVDADCRVHGVSNLFVAGSSVFVTGGTAAPTLTIVALALRLARHLRERHL